MEIQLCEYCTLFQARYEVVLTVTLDEGLPSEKEAVLTRFLCSSCTELAHDGRAWGEPHVLQLDEIVGAW